MTHLRLTAFLLLFLTACSNLDGSKAARGLGVVLNADAVIYLGSASFCTRPATIDARAVNDSTAEWREIQRDGIRPGSARHQLLTAKMHRRIVAACKSAAKVTGNDLIVREGDIRDSSDAVVNDLTAAVVSRL